MVDTTTLQQVNKPAPKIPAELAESPTFLLKRLGAIVKDKSIAAYEEAGAVPYNYAVLSVLAQGACATQATIADSLRYDRSYLVGLLDDLEERGLIERRRDLNDRRRHVVSLTPAGLKELDRLREVHAAIERDVFDGLSENERKSLQKLLVKLAGQHDDRYRR